MPGFERDKSGQAFFAGVPLEQLFHKARVATPAYFYDLDGMATVAAEMMAELRPSDLVAYAVKANSAASVIGTLARAGTGADVVSGGELRLALACGIAADKIVMSGVAKQAPEIDLAISANIQALHAESLEELERIAARAATLGLPARVSLRINPDVEIDSHAHISTGHDAAKFGIGRTELARAWEICDQHALLAAVGVSTHVGSLLKDPQPYLRSARAVCSEARKRREQRQPLEYVDFGGGFGIDYGGRPCSTPGDFVRAAMELLTAEGLDDHRLLLEPGRALVGPYGVLMASVVQAKTTDQHRWLMIDAGMNDLMRPALYGARHRIEDPASVPRAPTFRVVGPVCESSDDFGEHDLGDPPPERVVIRDVGAYGFTLASEYNGRPLPSEVFVSGGRVVQVSPAPSVDDWVKRRLQA